MKIRQGFVSNSSSSSFILSTDDYKSVFDVAKKMIPCREWEDSDKKLILKIEEAEIRGVDPNTSICFNSCNYETYIVKYKDFFLVSTCNNHNWDVSDKSYSFFPEELKELVSSDEEGYALFEELEGIVQNLSSFWYVEYDVGGKPLGYENPEREKFKCKKHYCDIIKINGIKNPICVECFYEKKQKELKEKENKKFSALPLIDRVSYVEDIVLKTESSLKKREKQRIFKTLEEVKTKI